METSGVSSLDQWQLLEAMPDAAILARADGTIAYANAQAQKLFGYTREELADLTVEALLPERLRQRHAEHRAGYCSHPVARPMGSGRELLALRRDGSQLPVEISLSPLQSAEGLLIVTCIRDITERKQAESERNITVQLLTRASAARSLHELLCGITSLLQRWSGCEAVGIRLRDGDDYPYYETRGFSSDFVLAENRLCAVDAQGRVLRDDTGNPVLECMCGNILCGRFDPKLPFFTEGGSFWTNNTAELLASTTEAQRQGRTRDRCNGEGYQSVALIPLRAAGETFGLLQFNDSRVGMFSAFRIGLFERLAYSIASALGQQKAAEALRKSEERLRHQQRSLAEAQRIAHLGSWEYDYRTREITASEEALRIHGLDPRQPSVAYETFLGLVHPDDREAVEAAVSRTTEDPAAGYEMQYRLVRPDGTERFVHARGEVFCDENGRPIRMIGTTHDITEQKEAEEALRSALLEITKLKERLEGENVYLQDEIRSSYGSDEIVGQSEDIRFALGKIEQVANTDANVLLLGETGTGKELFARAIHSRSARKDHPLVKVNCAALPSSLIESELFGHVKGAFTGALSDKVGRFELADGGTIFLDEIGELDPDLQTKLLRVLQEGEFERIGATETIQVDVRVIAATNRDLQRAMREGSFRPDLYYRLAVFPIEVPPLRLRPDDIPLLTWHFIAKKQRSLGKTIGSIPGSVMNALVEYDWPGNVRELENVIERAMILSPGSSLVLDESLAKPAHGDASEAPSSSLEYIDRTHIVGVLKDCGWKIKGSGNAADRLGLKPSTLRYRMRKLGIARPRRRPR